MNKKGFTLVELLVVIAIIAILAGGVVVMINPVQKLRESRDSRRVQDLQSVKQAIDLALTDGQITLNGDLSTLATGNSVTNGTAITADGSGGWVRVSTVAGQTGLGKYIPVLPNDPQGSNAPGGSGYEFVSNGEYYELKATFESEKYTTEQAAQDGGNEAGKYEVGTMAGFSL